jgi:hypothetical protein
MINSHLLFLSDIFILSEEQWSRTVGVKIPISPHVQGMSFSEHFNFCSMVTNEVVLHELCMFDEMMDIQLGYFFVVAGL